MTELHQPVKEDKTKNEKNNQQNATERIKNNGNKANFSEAKIPPKVAVETQVPQAPHTPQAAKFEPGVVRKLKQHKQNSFANNEREGEKHESLSSKNNVSGRDSGDFKRPPQGAKSPADLRSILAQISAAEKKLQRQKKHSNSVVGKKDTATEDLRSAF